MSSLKMPDVNRNGVLSKSGGVCTAEKHLDVMRMLLAAVAIGGLVLDACGQSDHDEVGNHLIAADGFPAASGSLVSVAGSVIDSGGGCLSLEVDAQTRYWMVWPEGAQRDSEPSVIELSDGQRVGVGDDVEASGYLQTRVELPEGDNPESMWGALAQFCLGDEMSESELFRAVGVRLL